MPVDGSDEKTANLEKLCSALERSDTFNITMYRNAIEPGEICGTPACILGHAWALWPHLDHRVWSTARHIGVDHKTLHGMCHSWHKYGKLGASFITGKMAAAALRRLHRTGEGYFSLEDA